MRRSTTERRRRSRIDWRRCRALQNRADSWRAKWRTPWLRWHTCRRAERRTVRTAGRVEVLRKSVQENREHSKLLQTETRRRKRTPARNGRAPSLANWGIDWAEGSWRRGPKAWTSIVRKSKKRFLYRLAEMFPERDIRQVRSSSLSWSNQRDLTIPGQSDNRHFLETYSVGARSGESTKSLYQHSTLILELNQDKQLKYTHWFKGGMFLSLKISGTSWSLLQCWPSRRRSIWWRRARSCTSTMTTPSWRSRSKGKYSMLVKAAGNYWTWKMHVFMSNLNNS